MTAGTPPPASLSGPGPCPTCARPVAPGTMHRPFCSSRCKMVDLGRWFSEEYVVPGEAILDLGALDASARAEGAPGGRGEDAERS